MFIRSSATRLFDVGLRKLTADQWKMIDWVKNKWMFGATSDKQTEKEYGMFGVNSIPQMTEGGDFDYLEVSTGYYKEFTHLTYGAGLRWSKEADEDELYGFFRKYPAFLTNAMHYTMEVESTSVFNNGFTVAGPDGATLFSTAHPCIDGTQSNRPAAEIELGFTGLQAALVSLSQQKNWENHPIIMPDTYMLMVHPNNLPMATKLVQTSKGQPFNANNTLNYLYNRFEIVVNPYITTATAWGCLPKPYDGGIMFFNRISPYLFTDSDTENLAKRTRIRTRFSVGYVDWHKTYGSLGA